MTRIIECAEACYETYEVPFGRIYEWHPQHTIIECDCGERFTLTATSIASPCRRCGTDHSALVRDIQKHEDRLTEEIKHPWHHDAQGQAQQHQRDEAACTEDSPWRYNDVTAGLDDEQRWKNA